ncbi:TMS membrane protein [Achlya hypogyna]|uniref:TMS membrane protein n=1 Tax=Achlya hypogyna TaxID=1202772 RepID=A0A1V9ZMC3_ACHHY|nr:TMS membrane protein [Achlya hypogyna]
MRRWPYLVLFFANAVVAALLVTYGQDLLRASPQVGRCNLTEHSNCLGNQTIYRASFVASAFFLVLMVLSALVERGAFRGRVIFGCQWPIFAGCLAAAFFVPNAVFDVYSWIAAVLSGIFILMQIIILLDFVYGIRDAILDRINDPKAQPSRLWPALYLILSVTGLALAVVGLAILFYYYGASGLGLFFLIVTSASVVLVTVLSVSERIGAGLLPPTCLSLYIVYLAWQALLALPDFEPTFSRGDDTASISIPSTILAALTVSYTGWRTSCSASALFRLDMPTVPPGDTVDSATVDVQAVTIEPRAETPSWQFHCIMFFSGIYMAMALTNWGVASGPYSNDTQRVSLWVQIASQWATTLLFTWSLIAPVVFPDRDFS